MNASLSDLSLWTPRRWLVSILCALLGQVALVFWLSNRHPPAPWRGQVSPPVRLGSLNGAATAADSACCQGDPTLFALVTPHGFSAAAWLTIPPFAYAPTNSPETPRWLAPPTEDLVDSFDEFIQTNLLAEETLAAKIPPPLSPMHLPTPVIVTAAVVKAEGGLAGRTLLKTDDLPIPAEPILTNTLVRVLVDSQGTTRTAALVARCSVDTADQAALAFARRARFTPVDWAGLSSSPGDMASGTLVFQWFQVRWNEPAALASQP